MANNFCTSCGAKIVGEGKFCASCGATVIEEEAKKQASDEIPAVTTDKSVEKRRNSVGLSDADVKDRKKKKLKLSIFVAIGVLLIAVIAVILIRTSTEPIKLPYGLTPEMEISETQEQMLRSGFVEIGADNMREYKFVMYDGSMIFGYMTKYTTLEHAYDGRYIVVKHCYFDPGYGAGNESRQFYDIRDRLTDMYGEPEFNGQYEWNDGEYTVTLSYSSASLIILRYNYMEDTDK